MNENPMERYAQDQLIIDDPARPEAERQEARLRQAFWLARYQPVKHAEQPADTFLAVWANLQLDAASSNWGIPRKRILRSLQRFFSQPSLTDALQMAGSQAEVFLRAELEDSARLYFTTCQKDSNYTSVLFNLIKMKEGQVAAKAANGAVDGILVPLVVIGEIPWREEMIAAVCKAYPAVFSEQPDALANRVRELKPEIAAQIERICANQILE